MMPNIKFLMCCKILLKGPKEKKNAVVVEANGIIWKRRAIESRESSSLSCYLFTGKGNLHHSPVYPGSLLPVVFN